MELEDIAAVPADPTNIEAVDWFAQQFEDALACALDAGRKEPSAMKALSAKMKAMGPIRADQHEEYAHQCEEYFVWGRARFMYEEHAKAAARKLVSIGLQIGVDVAPLQRFLCDCGLYIDPTSHSSGGPRASAEFFAEAGRTVILVRERARLARSKVPTSSGGKAPEGEWSPCMSKAEMASRLKLRRHAFETFTKTHPLRQIGRQLWSMLLDGMDARTRRILLEGVSRP